MLYAITDRELYGTDEDSRRQGLLERTAVWAANGVAFVQFREKDLVASEQVELARAMVNILRVPPEQPSRQGSTRLLINGRPDVALAAGADGVHLPSGPQALTPEEVRSIFAATNGLSATRKSFISISCHDLEDVAAARQQQVDCILFAPVFEKKIDRLSGEIVPGTGLQLLEEACRVAGNVPVFALGGITAKNAPQCIAAGTAGVAAIRLMLEPPSVWRNLA